MSKHLLAISLGPVQGFIAAARRTRDLWYGSYILSEVSKATASYLQANGCVLIFPAPSDESSLSPDSGLLVPNHILAEVPEGTDPKELAESAKEAANRRWVTIAETARKAAGDSAIRRDIWNEQIRDVLEFYAAWVPLDQDEEADKGRAGCEYGKARQRVECILAGRKALRDFRAAYGRAGIQKASLDGARESVLSDDVRRSSAIRLRLKIKGQEQLDAIGLVKRCGAFPKGDLDTEFVSVVRVAADPWIRSKAKTEKGREALGRIAGLCETPFAPRVLSDVYKSFPYDGTPLYPSRVSALKADPDFQNYGNALSEIERIVSELAAQSKDLPSPYFAVLLADGDRMGMTLSMITKPEEHRLFSRKLSEFAGSARQIIERYYGCLVYSGGDDVLAFLPIDTVLCAAKVLHDEFSERMKEAVTGPGCERFQPTLSVGISIGHCLEPLEDHLLTAREAERHAKHGKDGDPSDERNGLAVHYWTRGQEAIRVRSKWDSEPVERIGRWIEFLKSRRLSERAVYDLGEIAAMYTERDTPSVLNLAKHDTERLLRRKRVDDKTLDDSVIESVLAAVKSIDDLNELANEMLLARHICKELPKEAESCELQ